jgi:hypothetical protein
MTNKDLLRQYLNTGVQITKHQMEKLSPNVLKTYLRKRVIVGDLSIDEFDLLPEEFYPDFYENYKPSFTTNVFNHVIYKYGDNAIYNFIKYKGLKLRKDYLLVERLVSAAENDLMVSKEIMDSLGSNIGTDTLRAIFYSTPLNKKREHLTKYYIQNYLKDNPHDELYDDAVTALIHYSGDFENTIENAREIVNVKGPKLNDVEVDALLEYCYARIDSLNAEKLIGELMLKILKYDLKDIGPGVFIKRLTPITVDMVVSKMKKDYLAQYHKDKVFYAIKNGDPQYAKTFKTYYPLDKFTPKEVEVIHQRAKFFKPKQK